MSDLLAPRARHTQRLAGVQGRVGGTCSGEAGARLLRQLGMPTHTDTVLQLVHPFPLPECAPPSVRGVDDWTLKKRRSYGTILVDLKAPRVADLLPGRAAQTLTDWLKNRDTVTVIAHDHL